MRMSEDEQEEAPSYTSAVLARSLWWGDPRQAEWPRDLSKDLAAEAWTWQNFSQHADHFVAATLLRNYMSGDPEKRLMDIEHGRRIEEILTLMGGIGEQASLAWTTYIDAQRVRDTAQSRDPELHGFMLRAIAEHSAHFILGAANGLVNLVLRTILLNPDGHIAMVKKFKKADGFPPGSDERDAWVTFNVGYPNAFAEAIKDSGNEPMKAMVKALRSLRESNPFDQLDHRRGLDYHRKRPQSFRTSISDQPNPGSNKMFAVGSPQMNPMADAEEVFKQVADTIPILGKSMREIATIIGDAIRAEGFALDADKEWSARRDEHRQWLESRQPAQVAPSQDGDEHQDGGISRDQPDGSS